MTTSENQRSANKTDAGLTFLLDTNLGLPTDQRPWSDVLATAGITAKQTADLVYIYNELASRNPDIASSRIRGVACSETDS